MTRTQAEICRTAAQLRTGSPGSLLESLTIKAINLLPSQTTYFTVMLKEDQGKGRNQGTALRSASLGAPPALGERAGFLADHIPHKRPTLHLPAETPERPASTSGLTTARATEQAAPSSPSRAPTQGHCTLPPSSGESLSIPTPHTEVGSQALALWMAQYPSRAQRAPEERAKRADVATRCSLPSHQPPLAAAPKLPPQREHQAAEPCGTVPVQRPSWEPAALPGLSPWPQTGH